MTGTASNTPMTNSCYLVEIELKRVQTYLFEVPRLSVMVGANALLGETLRGFWLGDRFDPDIASLPGLAEVLAEEGGSEWLDGLPLGFSPLFGAQQDPLRRKVDREEIWQDDVAKVARKTGVLSRDGGHFEALFRTREAAHCFVTRAWELIQRRLPGIMLQIRVAERQRDGESWRENKEQHGPATTRAGVSILDLPQARVCEVSGEGPASEELAEADEGDRKPAVCQSVADRHQRGRAFDRGQTRDVLGILRPHLLRRLNFPENSLRAFPADFTELATDGYLAVIHVDGNRVGNRSALYANGATAEASGAKRDDFFDRWRRREQFYHTLRVGMRIAVTEALAAVIPSDGKPSRSAKVPARLLMLGGDDLVLVCGAVFALPFVVELARHVRETTKNLPDGKGPLTLGAGVAIVQDSFPFYRAYELADQLATSAKRLKASLPEAEGNVVDWLATSEAWYGDVEATRRDQYVVDDQLVLSAKPYRILKSPDLPGKSLEELLEDASRLSRDRVARNQLHGLANSLRQGRHTAIFAAEVLPEKLKVILKDRGYLNGQHGPWTELPQPGSSARSEKRPATAAAQVAATLGGPARRFLTRLLDLFELYELNQLAERAEHTADLYRSDDEPSDDEPREGDAVDAAETVAANEAGGAS